MNSLLEKKNGIILKKMPYAESDEIITVLLQGEGLRRFFVKGSRKSKKRFAGLIDYFAHLQFIYKKGDAGLGKVFEVEIAQPQSNRALLKETSYFAWVNYLSEIICECIAEGDGDHGLYDLWHQMQDEAAKSLFNQQNITFYLLNFLEMAGYAPDLNACSDCGYDLGDKTIFFDVKRGGLVCASCHPELPHDLALNTQVLQTIQNKEVLSHSNKNIWNPLLRDLILFSENIMQKKSRSAAFLLAVMS